MSKKLFDYVIGNPPFNEDFDNSGANGNFAKPVYNIFMDAADEVGEKVELVHPARFLFNVGSTPKEWNEKKLNDPHFKVLSYEEDGNKVFPSLQSPLKGGVAITYYDHQADFGAIGMFTAFPELNSIIRKCAADNGNNISDVIYTQLRFDLSALYKDYPNLQNVLGSGGNDRRFRNNIFEKVPEVFTEIRSSSADIQVLGVINKSKRVWRFIDPRYVDQTHENLKKWKVLVSRANGSGRFGEALTEPTVVGPFIGYTQTYIGIGAFDNENEANALNKYIKTKFLRTLLYVHKVTQDNDRGVWISIPLQDFSATSDIDWSKSIHEIDLQLYKKYNLSTDEINFIETHVKEMD